MRNVTGFVCKDTATAEIHTDWHTLSLHAALSIFEAVRATGASGAQVVAYGIVPQIMPAFAGISVFRWDINIRESTVLGLVGAGGIGLQLNASIRSEEHTSELQSLMRTSYAVFCLKKTNKYNTTNPKYTQ